MAKYERNFTGNFENVLAEIENGILNASMSATLEDGSDIEIDGAKCAVRVFERYSMAGSNRVSLNVTLLAFGGRLVLSAITAGGSQAVFFKVNTFGEEAFLQTLVNIVESF